MTQKTQVSLWLRLLFLLTFETSLISSFEHAGYSEPCTADIPCNPKKSLECRLEPGGADRLSIRRTCQCHQGYVYVSAFEGCLVEPQPANDWKCLIDSQCHTSELGRSSFCDQRECSCLHEVWDGEKIKKVVRLASYCYLVQDYGHSCVHDVECDPNANLKCIKESQDGSGVGQCGCDMDTHWPYFTVESHFQTCWPVNEGFPCQSLEQCEAAIGPLSICNVRAEECKCSAILDSDSDVEQLTGFYQGKCYYQKNVDEPCVSDGECRAGGAIDVSCHPIKKICLPPAKNSNGKISKSVLVKILIIFSIFLKVLAY